MKHCFENTKVHELNLRLDELRLRQTECVDPILLNNNNNSSYYDICSNIYEVFPVRQAWC